MAEKLKAVGEFGDGAPGLGLCNNASSAGKYEDDPK